MKTIWTRLLCASDASRIPEPHFVAAQLHLGALAEALAKALSDLVMRGTLTTEAAAHAGRQVPNAERPRSLPNRIGDAARAQRA